jgi:hypothetical protein
LPILVRATLDDFLADAATEKYSAENKDNKPVVHAIKIKRISDRDIIQLAK